MHGQATWAVPKRLISHSLCNGTTGALLALWFHNQIPNRGCRFDTNSSAVPAYKKALIFWGLFESAEYRFVRDYLEPDLDVVEFGSGIGVISSFSAQKLKPGRKLVCVEAHTQLLPLLEHNLAANAAHVTTRIVHGAVDPVAELEGTSSTFMCAASYTGSKLGSAEAGNDDRAEVVTALSLTKILREHTIDAYQLVSDIEGAEIQLFEQEPTAFDRCAKMIIELHETVVDGRRITVDMICDMIRQLGFQLVDRHGVVFVFAK